MIALIRHAIVVSGFASALAFAPFMAAGQDPASVCGGVASGWANAVASGKPAQIAAARKAAQQLSGPCPALQRRIAAYDQEVKQKAERERKLAQEREAARKREAARLAAEEQERERQRQISEQLRLAEERLNTKRQLEALSRGLASRDPGTANLTAGSTYPSLATGSTVALDPVNAALESSCLSGIGTDCLNLGYSFLNRTAVQTSDQDKDAAKFFRLACQAQVAEGCNNWGANFQNGQGETKDEKRAYDLYDQSCKMGYYLGCLNQGFLIETGKGTAFDPAAAADLYEKVCKRGIGAGCTSWGVMFSNGFGEQRDQKRAGQLFEEACNAFDGRGCLNRGIAFANGDLGRPNLSKAVEYFEKSCTLGFLDGCLTWGFAFESGKGVKEDLSRARIIYEQVCNSKYALGCLYAARSYLNNLSNNREKVQELLEKGIKLEPINGDLKALRDAIR